MEVEDQDRVISAGKFRTRTLPFAISLWGLAEGEEERGPGEFMEVMGPSGGRDRLTEFR